MKRWDRDEEKPSSESLERIQTGQIPAFVPAPQPLTSLPCVEEEFQFDPQFRKYDVAAKEARAYGVWADPRLEPVFLIPPTRTVQPTMPLRKGHLADLVVGGVFDSLLIERGNQRLLVKGRTIKERMVTRDGNRTQEIERFRPIVAIVNLETGQTRSLVAND